MRFLFALVVACVAAPALAAQLEDCLPDCASQLIKPITVPKGHVESYRSGSPEAAEPSTTKGTPTPTPTHAHTPTAPKPAPAPAGSAPAPETQPKDGADVVLADPKMQELLKQLESSDVPLIAGKAQKLGAVTAHQDTLAQQQSSLATNVPAALANLDAIQADAVDQLDLLLDIEGAATQRGFSKTQQAAKDFRLAISGQEQGWAEQEQSLKGQMQGGEHFNLGPAAGPNVLVDHKAAGDLQMRALRLMVEQPAFEPLVKHMKQLLQEQAAISQEHMKAEGSQDKLLVQADLAEHNAITTEEMQVLAEMYDLALEMDSDEMLAAVALYRMAAKDRMFLLRGEADALQPLA